MSHRRFPVLHFAGTAQKAGIVKTKVKCKTSKGGRVVARPNMLFTGDCLDIMTGMNSDSVDLIYLDPPFNSKRTYSSPICSRASGASFKDLWTWNDVDKIKMEQIKRKRPPLWSLIESLIVSTHAVHSKPMAAYVAYMFQRMVEMKRVLKPTGALYLHCDPTAGHYLKVLMDCIFGQRNFRNEIVWCYTGPSTAKRHFPRKTDSIFYYVKDVEQNYTFNGNDVLVPYKRLETGKTSGIFKKAHTLSGAGKIPENWWPDFSPVGRIEKERTGYPTQKPLALLHRIIKASSREGDVVLDPFCGCATTCVAAEHLKRKWIGVDISEKAAELASYRLRDDGGLFTNFTHVKEPPLRTDIVRKVIGPRNKKQIKHALGERDGRKCSACGLDSFKNLQIDHDIPRSRGGQDTMDNYRLLCGHCNQMKGSKTMAALLAKISEMEEALKQVSF